MERPVVFGPDRSLVGIIERPEEESSPPLPAFVLLNAGLLYRVGPSRLHVRLGRALSTVGFRSLRFDFSGVGDSASARDDCSFLERSVAETEAAMDRLESDGARSFVLAGVCSGAEVAHAAAVADRRVVGVVPVDGHLYPTARYYVHRYGPRLLRTRSWANVLTGRRWSRRDGSEGEEQATGNGGEGDAALFRRGRPSRSVVARELQQLADRGVRMLPVFTGDLEELCSYAGQFRRAFHDVDFQGLVEVEYLPRADHTFTVLEEQQRLVERIVRWARAGWAPPSVSGLPERAEGGQLSDHGPRNDPA